MIRYLLAAAALVAAIYWWQENGLPADGPGTPTSFRYDRGNRISLEPAGTVLLTGHGLNNGVMTIHCARGGFAFGFNRGEAIGLNGFSAGLARQGKVELGNGTKRSIRSTERPDLAAIGIIEPDADPVVYNRRMDEGLQQALKRCGT